MSEINWKCPKCGIYNAENPCEICGFKGEDKNFFADQYKGVIKIEIRVMAFNLEDAKKEINEMREIYGIDNLDYEIIELKKE